MQHDTSGGGSATGYAPAPGVPGTRVCPNCGNQAAQVINRRSTKFTLFFIPLIPVRTRHTQQCTFCGAEYEISRAEAERLPVG